MKAAENIFGPATEAIFNEFHYENVHLHYVQGIVIKHSLDAFYSFATSKACGLHIVCWRLIHILRPSFHCQRFH